MIERINFFIHVLLRNSFFSHKIYRSNSFLGESKVIGLTRLRNEELILQDSLDHMSSIVDGIIVYDDKSTDKSLEIAKSHPSVIEVISNKNWRGEQRAWEETANRKKLLDRAKRYNPEWLFYFDADERFEGEIRKKILNDSNNVDAIKIRLYDAYITKDDSRDYQQGDKLFNFRKKFGQERRDITMIWRNKKSIDYSYKPDMREPNGIESSKTIIDFYCQHYGKSISIEQWEDTCRYYSENFPMYADKWEERKGKAIHTKSDFGTDLMDWDNIKNSDGIKI
ncbi:hypothetical protein EOM27_01665 [Candidatus Saccharibacteria bacterium]|nr:hypothetical protein [Candidatus Saccharibacteria bacterium]